MISGGYNIESLPLRLTLGTTRQTQTDRVTDLGPLNQTQTLDLLTIWDQARATLLTVGSTASTERVCPSRS